MTIKQKKPSPHPLALPGVAGGLLSLALAGAASGAVAGTVAPPTSPPASGTVPVYRCGDSYSPRSCPGAAPLDVDDARTEAQRRQAQDVAARDRRLAASLEAQRHAREAEGSANGSKGPPAAVPRRTHGTACQPSATVVCPARAARARKAAASDGSGTITFRAPAAARAP